MRETCSFHPVMISCLDSFMVPSYDLNKKIHGDWAYSIIKNGIPIETWVGFIQTFSILAKWPQHSFLGFASCWIGICGLKLETLCPENNIEKSITEETTSVPLNICYNSMLLTATICLPFCCHGPMEQILQKSIHKLTNHLHTHTHTHTGKSPYVTFLQGPVYPRVCP